MTTGPFDDELLNAVIDGTADDATVAAVQADPVASARIAELRQVQELVGTTPPAATPERRSASIAAAMAAAQESAPEGVSSLAAARHAREAAPAKRRVAPRAWIAAAAAVVAVVLAIPILNNLGSDSADFASDAIDTSNDSFSADSGDDSADDSGGARDGSADEALSVAPSSDDDAATDDGGADDSDDSMEDAEMAADADATTGDGAATTTTMVRMTAEEFEAGLMGLPFGQIEAEIESGVIAPTYAYSDDIIQTLVSPECLEGYEDNGTAQFDLVIATDTGRRILIGFSPGGSFEILDAETC